MIAVRRETELDRRDPKSGTTRRQILLEKVRRGDAAAIRELESLDYPEQVDYLEAWSRQLFGRSGLGMSGFAPLTFTAIRDWSAVTGNTPNPLEIDALMQLDAIRCAPEPDTTELSQDTIIERPAWPTKKRGTDGTT